MQITREFREKYPDIERTLRDQISTILIVSVVLLFLDLPMLDPILSILITLYVLYNVVKKVKSTLSLFLQAVPKDLNISHIEASIQELKNVRSTHQTHIWSLDDEHHVLTTHVVLEEDIPKDEVIHIKEKIGETTNQLKIIHTTVEIEYGKEECTSGRER